MKTINISLLLCALVLAASCAKDVSETAATPSGISFRPVVGSEALKSIFNGNALPTDADLEFNVCGIAVNVKRPDGTIGNTRYFVNKPVSYYTNDEGLAGWWFSADASGIVPRYYWPVTGGLYFYAYCPTAEYLIDNGLLTPKYDETSGTYREVPDQSGGSLRFIDYTIKHFDGAIIEDDGQKTDTNLANAEMDFMTAIELYDDVTKRASNSVPLLFTHNLTQLRFSAIAERDLSNTAIVEEDSKAFLVTNNVTITVDKIALIDAYSTATYSITTPHWNDYKEKYSYFPLTRPFGTGTALEYEDGDLGERTPSEVQICKYDAESDTENPVRLLVIPQSLTDAKINVWFSINQHTTRQQIDPGTLESIGELYSVNDYTEELVKTVNLSDITLSWPINTCLTYVFHIDLNDIKVTVDYDTWKSSGELTPVI